MVSSQMNKVSYHARSISLVSTPHPVKAQFDEQVCKLRSSEAASTSTSSSLTDKLTGLTELYGLVDELIQLLSNQQSGSQIPSMLDGSVKFLDICNISRDILVQLKECLHGIQSVVRRRCSGELNITSVVSEYLKTRKTVKRTIKRCLKNINVSDKSDEANGSQYFLNDVEVITADIFTSLLSYIGCSKSRTSWSIVPKLIHKKEPLLANTSQFDAVDATLESLVCQKKTGANVEIIRNQMMALESEIQELDGILECLFRHLVKTRATLLNILSK